jgi:hypothetical protein
MLSLLKYRKTFNIEFVGIRIIYLAAKFHILNTNGLLVINTKCKAQYKFHGKDTFLS